MLFGRAGMPRFLLGVLVAGLIVAHGGAPWMDPGDSLALAIPSGCVRTPPPSTPTFIARAFTSAIQKFPRVPGVALSLYSNGQFYPFYTGEAIRGHHPRCIDDRTIMEIGSVTKSVTAILLAMAYANSSPVVSANQNPGMWINPLSGGNNVGARCPPPPTPSAAPTSGYGVMQYATLESLSSFTAGLPDGMPYKWGLKRRPCWSANQLINFVETYPKPSPVPLPPYPYNYSNMGYGAMGYVLQGIYKKPWFQIAREQLLGPLSMTHTVATGHVPQQGFAQGYECDGFKPAYYWTQDAWPAAGALRSTLQDMQQYLGAVVGSPSAPPNITAAVKVAMSPIVQVSPSAGHPAFQQAMAWRIDQHGQYYVTGKDGGTAGFNAWIGAILPATNPSLQPIGIVVLTNRSEIKCGSSPADAIGRSILLSLAPSAPTATPLTQPRR